MVMANGATSEVLAAMADGIGDLTFGSPEWVDAAREVLDAGVARRAKGLADLGTFTMCEGGHNPPAYLHCGTTLAWHARFDGATGTTGTGERDEPEWDSKMAGEHSIISNFARLQ